MQTQGAIAKKSWHKKLKAKDLKPALLYIDMIEPLVDKSKKDRKYKK